MALDKNSVASELHLPAKSQCALSDHKDDSCVLPGVEPVQAQVILYCVDCAANVLFADFVLERLDNWKETFAEH